MDPLIIRIARDVEAARRDGVCQVCLADLLVSALRRVLDDTGDPAATVAAARTLTSRQASVTKPRAVAH